MQHLLSTETLRFAVLCALWYTSSTVTNNIGKQLLGLFNFPVTLTWVQFGFVAAMSLATGMLVTPKAAAAGFGRIRMPSVDVIRLMAPLSGFLILGHVFGTMAIARVPVSFVHTIKALSPLFTVLVYRFSYKIRYTRKVYIALLPLTLGVMIFCSNKVTFNVLGFLFAVGSTVIFVLQNILTKRLFISHTSRPGHPPSKKLDKLNMLFVSSALAFLLMAPLWFYADGHALFFSNPTVAAADTTADDTPPSPSPPSADHHHHPASAAPRITGTAPQILLLFLVNGTTHYTQAVLAFWILSLVSPITYTVASLLKRIVVICASILWAGGELRGAAGLGVAMTALGLWMYDRAKEDVGRGEDELVFKTERAEWEKSGVLPMVATPQQMSQSSLSAHAGVGAGGAGGQREGDESFASLSKEK
ncbi:triose-phosphate transporter family-domain-containing protein [Zopfochytrium polystomum]|nr:triose-phosphate transporter family-domain-containing protein [Zopfochytrium polystomum]